MGLARFLRSLDSSLSHWLSLRRTLESSRSRSYSCLSWSLKAANSWRLMFQTVGYRGSSTMSMLGGSIVSDLRGVVNDVDCLVHRAFN